MSQDLSGQSDRFKGTTENIPALQIRRHPEPAGDSCFLGLRFKLCVLAIIHDGAFSHNYLRKKSAAVHNSFPKSRIDYSTWNLLAGEQYKYLHPI